jgi:polyphenol oxidase
VDAVLASAGEVVWLPAPAGWPAAVTAGVSTRRGGVSRAHLAALNLGTRVGDDPAAIEENLARLSRAAGVPLEAAARVPLRHGAFVHRVGRAGLADPGDGLVTTVPGLPLALTVADCYPLLLAAGSRAVALAHCGWRGCAAGIAPVAVGEIAAAAGVAPAELDAWVGPGIGPCCYHLPRADARRFPESRRAPGPDGEGKEPRERVDLAGFLEDELVRAGVRPDRITAARLCTACRPDLFYSHRRDAGRTGRMLAWIMLAP